ncbi:MAG: beta-ketoacyl-[acyl-carrier-protein] synthase family protein [Candidatus Cryptobacteroides sp.]
MRKPVYITGAGVICACGTGKAEVLESLRSKRSGIGPLRNLDDGGLGFPSGEVPHTDEELKAMLGISGQEVYGRTALLGIVALREALMQAGLEDGASGALISGTTVGGMDVSERHWEEMISGNTKDSLISLHDCGSTTELQADYFGGFSRITTLSTACSSAANAIIRGADMIQSGETSIVVAGGSECLSRFHINGFNSLMILDKEPCRPFDRTRAGLNLGEGAAYLVLESEESVVSRGVRPIAVLSGCGNACDAFHQTATSPEGTGACLSMMKALEDASLRPSDISYVNAHGTGTPDNDASESTALRTVFGDCLPAVSSTKSFTGHTTSASGSIEAVICLLALANGFIPANLNWTESDGSTIEPSQGAEEVHHTNILCNSFGFGGNDSSIIISPCK